ATRGTLEGLKNPELFDRKVKMEQKIRANASGKTYWDDMAKYYQTLNHHTSEIRFLSPTPLSGDIIPLMYAINEYMGIAAANPESPELNGLESKLKEMAVAVNDPEAAKGFSMVLTELKQFSQPDDEYLKEILDGRTPDAAAKEILAKTIFADEKDLAKLFDKKTKKILNKKDPLIEAAQLLGEQYKNAVAAFQSTGVARNLISQNVAGEVFKVYGNSLPPDATFTLRISDGVVKGYDYNGTKAPAKTTYYGLYDRYESNDGQFPWSLPERWKNPPAELLKASMNFVCTADIVGGNSGSSIINVKHEVVGLAFDGNMESLPGKFIFDEKGNRTVGVSAGGIVAALRYIYKADRLVAELTGK
ncbi:MAG TPA: S46 family peptidase, partial [Saprospiraceae bacterium]|nr:S46 family peptidase [Saprospiraceae bacterium]